MRSHSDPHKRAIKEASARLHEERDVGKQLRRTNPVLFAMLLAGTRSGSTRVVDDLSDLFDAALSEGRIGKGFAPQPSPNVSNPQVSRAPIAPQQNVSNPQPSNRPPIPRMDNV